MDEVRDIETQVSHVQQKHSGVGECEQYHGDESEPSVDRGCECKSSFVTEDIKKKQNTEQRYAREEDVGYISCCSEMI